MLGKITEMLLPRHIKNLHILNGTLKVNDFDCFINIYPFYAVIAQRIKNICFRIYRYTMKHYSQLKQDIKKTNINLELLNYTLRKEK